MGAQISYSICRKNILFVGLQLNGIYHSHLYIYILPSRILYIESRSLKKLSLLKKKQSLEINVLGT